ncbi:MAG: hypothetical protein JWM97_1353 [Phycisphaerales bacterium]|nr:hypothetical protein [Phycisphaerales bacterium]MDB5303804.1 hypothetical protein [Phycisphaerales bacterium]
MGRTRTFLESDIPAVAGLWMKMFRARRSPARPSLLRYFNEVFFENPWREDGPASRIYEDDERRLAGFLGVMPRRMLFEGRPIRVAVSTQIMVDPDRRCPFAAVQLQRDFFSGPQDLSLTDGANDVSRKLWEGLGGSVALMYSLEWTRVLRPTRHAAEILSGRKPLATALHAAGPLCTVMDAAAARLPFGPFRVRRSPLLREEATVQLVHACVEQLGRQASLRPQYDPDSLKWLLDMATHKEAHGRFHKVVARDAGGRIAGWYLYYLKPGGASQVVQIGAREGSAGDLLDALFHDASAGGSTAVCGQFDPTLVRELSDRHCDFRCRSLGVLVHSRNKDLLQAILRGDACLSRLEGEWCLRFGRDEFK